MPPKGWKAKKLADAVEEAAVWKRQFFRTKRYSDVRTLVADAHNGGLAEVYVRGILAGIRSQCTSPPLVSHVGCQTPPL